MVANFTFFLLYFTRDFFLFLFLQGVGKVFLQCFVLNAILTFSRFWKLIDIMFDVQRSRIHWIELTYEVLPASRYSFVLIIRQAKGHCVYFKVFDALYI